MTSIYSMVQDIPDHVGDEERIARSNFSSSDARKGKVTLNAFNPPKDKSNPDKRIREISVDRFDHLELRRAVELGHKRAELRTGASFRGWAILLAGKARQCDREVNASPLFSHEEINLAHADILLPESTTDDGVQRKRHLSALAELSSWQSVEAPEDE